MEWEGDSEKEGGKKGVIEKEWWSDSIERDRNCKREALVCDKGEEVSPYSEEGADLIDL